MKDPTKATGRPASPAPARRTQTVFALCEQETFEFGMRFARGLGGGELVLLEGELGAGKTVFAKGLAAGLDIAEEQVTSPTFTLIHEHRGGRYLLYHVDLYRLEGEAEIETLGLGDLLAANSVVVVEWGERLSPHHRRGAIAVRITDIGEGSRRIEILPESRGAKPGTDA